MGNKDYERFQKNIVFRKQLKGFDFTFHTTWGLFSPKDIDEGTELLINNIEVNPQDTILDLGCGYGAIGVTLANLCPHGKVHMVDKDFVAVEYAKKNAELNNVENTEVYLSNGFSNVQEMNFDLVVSNVPAKVGKELYWIMMNDAKNHLKIGGKIYFVFISGLKEYFKRNFREIFGNYAQVAQSKTYTVALAVKE